MAKKIKTDIYDPVSDTTYTVESERELTAADIQAYLQSVRPAPAPVETPQQQPSRPMLAPMIEPGYEDLSKTLKANMETPAGMAGATIGGTVAGVPGAIIGGAGGTFIGSLMSDVLTDKEPNYVKAAEEAAISTGVDLLTLGAGKVFRPIAQALGVTPDQLIFKFSANMPSPATGTLESFQQTQALLQQGGGSLSPMQTNRAGRFRRLAEQLGDIGIFSGQRSRMRIQQNANILKEEVQNQINGINPTLTMSSDMLGQSLVEIIQLGKKANSQIYSNSLDAISQQYGKQRVKTQPLVSALQTFQNEYRKEYGSALTDVAQKELNDLLKGVGATGKLTGGYAIMPTMSIDSLLSFQKRLNNQLSQLSDLTSPNRNMTAANELSVLSSRVRKVIGESLENLDPQLAMKYAEMNKSFGDSAELLMPKVTTKIIGNAEQGFYESLGNMVLANPSADRVYGMMRSIDEAFRLAKKEGIPLGTFQSAAQAKQSIRQSYVANLFGDVSGAEDIYKPFFRNMADKLEHPSMEAKTRAVMGENYNQFKRLLNAINDASPKTESSLFGLMLRSKESTAVSDVLRLASVGAISQVSSLGTAAMVFAIPEVFSIVANNKTAVNRLLNLNRVSTSKDITPEVITSLTTKVFESLTDDEKSRIQEYFGTSPEQ